MDFPLRMHGVRIEGDGALNLEVAVGSMIDRVAAAAGHRATVTKIVPGASRSRSRQDPIYADIWFYFDDELWKKMNSDEVSMTLDAEFAVDPDHDPQLNRTEPIKVVGGRRIDGEPGEEAQARGEDRNGQG